MKGETIIMKLKVIIWGAGYKGKNLAKEIEQNYDCLDVTGFGDNDTKKIGNFYDGVIVYRIDEVKKNQKDIDCVIISIPNEENLYKQLVGELEIPIYRDVFELMNKRFSIDITGWCNGKCKWCYTGRKNYMNESLNKKYMRYEEFVRVHRHLINAKIMYPFQEIILYSWGEPFLNPDYLKIIDYLAQEEQLFSISTNASCPQYTINSKAYKNCNTVVFSLSGISNKSYKRIHGFDIEIIKKNIKKIIEKMRKNGFQGDAKLSFHVYNYNQNEVEIARKFAEDLNILFESFPAYLCIMSMQTSFWRGEINNEEIQEIRNELIMSHIPKLINERPADYRCPLENMISIDCDGKLELCCGSDAGMKDFKWCSIFDIKKLYQWQKYRAEMLNSTTCNECRKWGIDYQMCNNPNYDELNKYCQFNLKEVL